jgi:hypothetical protein
VYSIPYIAGDSRDQKELPLTRAGRNFGPRNIMAKAASTCLLSEFEISQTAYGVHLQREYAFEYAAPEDEGPRAIRNDEIRRDTKLNK